MSPENIDLNIEILHLGPNSCHFSYDGKQVEMYPKTLANDVSQSFLSSSDFKIDESFGKYDVRRLNASKSIIKCRYGLLYVSTIQDSILGNRLVLTGVRQSSMLESFAECLRYFVLGVSYGDTFVVLNTIDNPPSYYSSLETKLSTDITTGGDDLYFSIVKPSAIVDKAKELITVIDQGSEAKIDDSPINLEDI